MEILFALAVLVLAAAAVLGVHHHFQVAAWDRELDQAFGTASRDIPSHRAL